LTYIHIVNVEYAYCFTMTLKWLAVKYL